MTERGKCSKCLKRTRHKSNEGLWLCLNCDMGLEDKLTDRQERILSLLDKSKLTNEEIKAVLTSRKVPTYNSVSIDKTKITYAVISDTHIGHKCYDSELMDRAAKEINKRKVDFVIHGGDVLEGHYEAKRHGHIFELEHVGGDEQIKRAVKELGKINKDIPIYAVVGNHENNTYGKAMGFDIGERLKEKLPNYKHLGVQHGEIDLPFGKKILVVHPDGGSSYAISYRSQKMAESLDGGKKPAILHIGHYHKSEYLFYRNIHIIQNGCFESQTPFMRNLSLSAHKGYWIISLEVSKNGIEKFAPEFFPKYD